MIHRVCVVPFCRQVDKDEKRAADFYHDYSLKNGKSAAWTKAVWRCVDVSSLGQPAPFRCGRASEVLHGPLSGLRSVSESASSSVTCGHHQTQRASIIFTRVSVLPSLLTQQAPAARAAVLDGRVAGLPR
jgi:hypothetical protein